MVKYSLLITYRAQNKEQLPVRYYQKTANDCLKPLTLYSLWLPTFVKMEIRYYPQQNLSGCIFHEILKLGFTAVKWQKSLNFYGKAGFSPMFHHPDNAFEPC